jgi:CheY-like chemotaxis protein
MGSGATFTVTLPLARRPAAAIAAAEELPDLTGVQILIVDDDDNGRRMVKAALARCGANVETAGGVAAARTSLARRTPHIVITDIAMPDEDGFALLRHVRANEQTRRVPVFALTAFHHREDLQKEFDVLLRKPIDPMEIARRVARSLN